MDMRREDEIKDCTRRETSRTYVSHYIHYKARNEENEQSVKVSRIDA